MSRGDAVKGIFYHVVTKFCHSVMLKILFDEMMINGSSLVLLQCFREKELGNCSRYAIIRGGFLEENEASNYQL